MAPLISFFKKTIFRKIFLFLGVVLVSSYLALIGWNYSLMKNEAVSGMRERLLSIARTGVLQIDGEGHLDLQTEYILKEDLENIPEARTLFNRLYGAILAVKNVNNLKEDVYTLSIKEGRGDALRGAPAAEHKDALEFILGDKEHFHNSWTYRPMMERTLLKGEAFASDLYTDEEGAWISAFAPIAGPDGAVAGMFEVDYSFAEYLARLDRVLYTQLAIGLSLIAGILFVSFFITRNISRPIVELAAQARRFGDGDYHSAITVRSSDETRTLADVMDGARERINSFIAEVMEMSPDIILLFGRDFLVKETASRAAFNLLGKEIAGRRVFEVLPGFEKKKDEQEVFVRGLFDSFTDPELFTDLMRLVCERIEVNGRLHAFRFFPRVDGGEVTSVFVLGVDISEAEQAKAETKRAVMFLNLIKDADNYLDLSENLKTIFEQSLALANPEGGAPGEESLRELFRLVHTLKGSFGMFEMFREVELAQELETNLEKHLATGDAVSPEGLLKELKALQKQFFETESRFLALIGERGGGELLKISKPEVERMRNWAANGETKTMSLFLDSLPLPLLSHYLKPKVERLVKTTSQKLEKNVEVAFDIGEDIRIPRPLVRALDFCLPHLVRNSVDHGIEDPEGRFEAGKPEEGRLSVRSEAGGGTISISIQDDGRGVDPDVVRQKALEKGLISAEIAGTLSEEDIRRLLLMPGFSTKGAATEVSGRGVGLDAVDHAVREAQGRLELSSEKGKFTRFQLTFRL